MTPDRFEASTGRCTTHGKHECPSCLLELVGDVCLERDTATAELARVEAWARELGWHPEGSVLAPGAHLYHLAQQGMAVIAASTRPGQEPHRVASLVFVVEQNQAFKQHKKTVRVHRHHHNGERLMPENKQEAQQSANELADLSNYTPPGGE